MTPCSRFCPLLACPTCAYQGGASERGTRHVSAGETACLPLDLGGGEGKMEDVSDPRERLTPGVRPDTYVRGTDMATIPPPHPHRMPIAEARLKTQPTVIYRLYAEDGSLLYIGLTCRWLVDRLTAHRRTKSWWSEVASVSIEPQRVHYWESLNAERAAIKAEHPRYNKRSAVHA